MMDLSVIIATYNRERLLRGTLEGILDQSIPLNDYEVIIVDNNSTDATKAVVGEFRAVYPHVRYVFEGNQGLSHARNRGIAEAGGRLLSFIDDDVMVDRDYLCNIRTAFDDNPTVEAVCGRVFWTPQVPIPFYFKQFGCWVTTMDYGNEPFFFNERRDALPFGVSMAFRREVFQKYGVFNIELGRIKDKLLSHEEIELFSRILANEQSCLYEPKAVLHHVVLPERMTLRFLVRWHYWFGVSDARLYGLEKTNASILHWISRKRTYMEDFWRIRTAMKKLTLRKLMLRIYLAGFILTMIRNPDLSPQE